MQISVFDDDEPIHHHAGKDIFEPCPRVTNTPTAKRGNNSLDTTSPPVTISPPSKQHILELCQLEQDRQRTGMLGLFHRVLDKLHLHESNTIVVNNFFYQGLAIQANNNNYNEMKNYNPVFNIYNRGNNNSFNYYDNSKSQKEEAEAEDVNFEEVKTNSKHEQTNIPVEGGDNNSRYPQLLPYLTYPQHADYLVGWLQMCMATKDSSKGIVMPLKATYDKGLFIKKPPVELVKEVFGYEIDPTWYSRLMGDGNYYTDDEINLTLKTLDLDVFK